MATKKQRDACVQKACTELADAIADLPLDAPPSAVVEAFKNHKSSAETKADAFWMMDNKPGLFRRHTEWHPKLRAVRNTPEYGRALFALFKEN